MRSARIQLVGGISAIFACFFLLSVSSGSSAQTTPISPWLATNNPTLEKINDLTPPWHVNTISNRGCQERETITRPARYVPIPQTKKSFPDCVVDTGFGAISGSGYLQRQGGSVSGLLKTSKGDSAIMIPIPRSSTGILVSGGGAYGSYLFFYDYLESGLSSNTEANGEVTHKLPPDYSMMLKNGNGELLAADTSAMSFSVNGDWAVVDIPFIAMARINTKTREILPFMSGSNPFSAVGTAYRTAVSPDGRYAVVASRNFEIFRLYDLSTCGSVPRVITQKVDCEYRNLLPFVRQQIPGFTSVASMRLRSNYTLDLYANSIVGTTYKITRYLVTADGQQAPGFQYLALGDSFASGEGAYNYKAATDTTENKCHLSQRSYPYLISSALGYGQYESVACSGAISEDISTESLDYVGQAGDDIKLKDRNRQDYLSRLLPGYLPQREFIRELQPSVITLSAGGNDIGFSDIILRCIDTDTCYSSFEDRLELADLINKQFQPLSKMYNEVKAASDPRSKIYIIGYPQIAKPDGACDMNVHLNRDERVFAEQLVSHLNSVIKKAAENTGVFYVDVEEAFNGHKMCEPLNSWDVAVNGLTAGNDQVNFGPLHGPVGNESYHPNAFGHSLLKVKILEKTNNFTATMPAPNTAITAGDLNLNSPLLAAPKTNRSVRILKHYTGTDGGVMNAGKYWTMRASGLDLLFAAGSKIKAELHSSPINLGEYTLAQDGSIDISANIPAATTPGMHTLHLYGKNSSGEDIDLFKTVYVTAGSPCVVPLSGQDKDKDGTDDACDGFIDQPPIVVAPPMKKPPTIALIGPSNTIGTTHPQTTNPQIGDEEPIQTIALVQTAQTQPTATPQAVTTAETQSQPSVLGANTQTEQNPTTETAATFDTAQPSPRPKTLLSYWPVVLLFLAILLVLVFILA